MRRSVGWLWVAAVLLLVASCSVRLVTAAESGIVSAEDGHAGGGFVKFCAAAPDHRTAIVRIVSHGITGAIIETRKDWSLILSCGHGFYDQQAGMDFRKKAIVVDVPYSDDVQMPKMNGHPRLLALDVQNDLSLIELPAGPLTAIPLSDGTRRPGKKIWSCGYDEMKWTDGPLVRATTILRDNNGIIWTKEIPWHGRSGGPLIDAETMTVIGVVEGYETSSMGKATGPGMYINTTRVMKFVGQYRRPPKTPSPVPQVYDLDGSGEWRQDPNGGWYRGGIVPKQSDPFGLQFQGSPRVPPSPLPQRGRPDCPT